ncbi:hypothetical protein [Amycolatopsis sp. NPDC049868]|uniref:hypothetical protein n=1 Tax=Amycolatopsis sp. NPDC049868 TaxID=3363934 RepID=UPI00378FBED8
MFYGEQIAAEVAPTVDVGLIDQSYPLVVSLTADKTTRSVRLRGRTSGAAYVDATCVLVPEHLPSEVLRDLATTDVPLGALLHCHKVPVLRRIIASGFDESGADQRPWRRSMVSTAQGLAAVVHEMFILPERARCECVS